MRRLAALAGALLLGCSQQPARRVVAHVTSVVPLNSRPYADILIVSAAAPDGVIGFGRVNTRGLTCRVGDEVDGVEQGVTLSVRLGTCRRAAKSRR